MSICSGWSLIVALCSVGSEGGASGGKADENDHSSSSFATAGAGGATRVMGLGVDGLEEVSWEDARAAKGSWASFCGGGGRENVDCWSKDGCGVDDCDVEG